MGSGMHAEAAVKVMGVNREREFFIDNLLVRIH